MNELERTKLEAELKATKEYTNKLENILKKMSYENRQIIKHNDLTVRIMVISFTVLGIVYFICKMMMQFWQ